MLTIICNDKNDLIEKLISGGLQEEIKEYLERLLDEEVEFSSSDEVLEYFDLEYRNENYDISYEALLDDKDTRGDVKTLRTAILATYERVLKEYKAKTADKDKRFTVRLTAYQIEALNEYADNHDMKASEVIRKYINSLNEYKKIIKKEVN